MADIEWSWAKQELLIVNPDGVIHTEALIVYGKVTYNEY
jgi:hypothetical protein